MYYVYEIEHITSGLRYIGSRTSISAKEIDILKSYFTSSNTVKNIIESEGIDSFRLVKTLICNSVQECLNLEDFLLKNIEKSEREKYLNLNFSAGGSVIKSQTHLRITDGKKYQYIPKNSDIPPGWYLGTNSKPPKHSGKRKWTHIETGISKLSFEIPGDGYILSVDLTKQKNKIAQMEKKIKDNIPNRNELMWINNGIINKKIRKTDMIPDGFNRGKIKGRKQKVKRLKGSTTGKIAINNGKEIKFVDKTSIIPDGWIRGILKK